MRKSSTTGRMVTVPVAVLLGNLGAEIHLYRPGKTKGHI